DGDGPGTATRGASFTAEMGRFALLPGESISDFTATIDWGDGQSDHGQLSALGGTGVAITGTHAYAHVGVFRARVVLIHDMERSVSTSEVVVIPAPGDVAPTGPMLRAPAEAPGDLVYRKFYEHVPLTDGPAPAAQDVLVATLEGTPEEMF